jgi:hypothetical protein
LDCSAQPAKLLRHLALPIGSGLVAGEAGSQWVVTLHHHAKFMLRRRPHFRFPGVFSDLVRAPPPDASARQQQENDGNAAEETLGG